MNKKKQHRLNDIINKDIDRRLQRRQWFTNRGNELRSLSKSEAALWTYLRDSKTGHLFHWNFHVPPYIPDFVCFNCAIIVEVDGEDHAATASKDEERDMWFTSRGCKVMRFMARDVMAHPKEIAAQVKAEADERVGMGTMSRI